MVHPQQFEVPPEDCATSLPAHAAEFFDRAIEAYQADGLPVDTSFRALLPGLKYGERATHFLHPYPGKLIAHIPFFFLRLQGLVDTNTRVLDPFCGSGTTLVESLIRGVESHGLDVNPFAVLLSASKCSMLDAREIIDVGRAVAARMKTCEAVPRLIPNATFWYAPETLLRLFRLRTAVEELPGGAIRQFMLVAMSTTARTLSFADPRLPVPVRVQPQTAKAPSLRVRFAEVERRARSGDVSAIFLSTVAQSAARYESLRSLVANSPGSVTCSVGDIIAPSVSLPPHSRGDFDLLITSPPYCGAQKYVRSTAHAIAWTMPIEPSTLADLESTTIGREHVRKAGRCSVDLLSNDKLGVETVSKVQKVNAVRGQIAATYLNEMEMAVGAMAAAVRTGGHLVLVIGDNLVGGMPFPATALLRAAMLRQGLEEVVVLRDSIPSRGLMTKRNGQNKPIAYEYVVVMRKPSEGTFHAGS